MENITIKHDYARAGSVPGVEEVLFRDGAVVEGLAEDFLDPGKPVEPNEDGFAFQAVVEAGVELGADVPGEPGDFSDAGHSDVSFRWGRRAFSGTPIVVKGTGAHSVKKVA